MFCIPKIKGFVVFTCASRRVRAESAARGNQLRIIIYIPARKYFAKISFYKELAESVYICYDKDTKRRTPIRRLLLHRKTGITAYRVKVGRLFLFYADDVASDEN
jgi:hypothetical protein